MLKFQKAATWKYKNNIHALLPFVDGLKFGNSATATMLLTR